MERKCNFEKSFYKYGLRDEFMNSCEEGIPVNCVCFQWDFRVGTLSFSNGRNVARRENEKLMNQQNFHFEVPIRKFS
jgi:hypothetical protein